MSTYARALTQRNNLLRQIREERPRRDELRYWDDVVINDGGRSSTGGAATLAALAEPLAAAHREIAAGRGSPRAALPDERPARKDGETTRDALRRRLIETPTRSCGMAPR